MKSCRFACLILLNGLRLLLWPMLTEFPNSPAIIVYLPLYHQTPTVLPHRPFYNRSIPSCNGALSGYKRVLSRFITRQTSHLLISVLFVHSLWPISPASFYPKWDARWSWRCMWRNCEDICKGRLLRLASRVIYNI